MRTKPPYFGHPEGHVPTYSQGGEDTRIAELFARRGILKASLLDIGAWDPFDKSNSRLLLEGGWWGILVEPSPGAVRTLLDEYGDDETIKVIAAAVMPAGTAAKFSPLHITDDAVSTTSAAVHETWKQLGGYFGRLWCPTITLSDIFNQFGGDFQFVNIDAEGVSVDLAIEYLRTEAYPAVLCVEHDGRTVELMQCAQERGYLASHLNGTNIILEHR